MFARQRAESLRTIFGNFAHAWTSSYQLMAREQKAMKIHNLGNTLRLVVQWGLESSPNARGRMKFSAVELRIPKIGL